MEDDDLYTGLPDDQELAFLKLEEVFRDELIEAITAAVNDHVKNNAYVAYINKTAGAAKALDIEGIKEYEAPRPENATNVFSSFSRNVENIVVQLKIRHGRRAKGYSIALDPAAKERLRHHLAQICLIVDRLEVEQNKKESLYRCIAALEDEVNRERTRMEAYGALAMEIANTGGKVARELKPAWSLVGTIGKLLGLAKDREASMPPLRLEPPQRRLAPPKSEDAAGVDLDEDRA